MNFLRSSFPSYDEPFPPLPLDAAGDFSITFDRKWIPYMISLLMPALDPLMWQSDGQRASLEANDLLVRIITEATVMPDCADISFSIDGSGHLIFTCGTNDPQDLGQVTGAQGDPGPAGSTLLSYSSSTISNNTTQETTFSDVAFAGDTIAANGDTLELEYYIEGSAFNKTRTFRFYQDSGTPITLYAVGMVMSALVIRIKLIKTTVSNTYLLFSVHAEGAVAHNQSGVFLLNVNWSTAVHWKLTCQVASGVANDAIINFRTARLWRA